jgi:two-component sensor histidine kinase
MTRATTFSSPQRHGAALVLPPLATPTAADEGNHRIANSLQMIAALLTIDAREVADPAAAAALRRSRQRIEAIGAMHRQLHTRTDASQINLDIYLQTLGEQIGRTCPGHRPIIVAADTVLVDAAKASSIGMLMVELVTNACKHAYAAHAPGHVLITLLRHAPGKYRFMVEDRGTGTPGARRIDGLGSRLIAATVARLGASSVWEDAAPGTRFYMDVGL